MSAEELQIKTAALPSSRMSIELLVPATTCQACYDEALARLSQTIKLPGFRKGKVPKAVILQQIGSAQVRASALEKLIEKVWKEALKEKSIEPLCEPELKDGFEALFESYQPGIDLKITLETDVAPKPKLKKTQGLTAEIESETFDKSKVEELIEQSRKQLATLVPVENRPAAMGDVAVVSFKGTYIDNNQEIEGGSAESMDIDLEEGRMIPGFIEGIIGMELNTKKTVSCKFPDDYTKEDARGRKANFLITLNDLKARELPDLNDDFAQQASDKKNMNELRNELEKRLKDDVERSNQNNRQEALINELVKELEVELPKTLVDQEVRNLVEQTARNFAQQGMDVKSMFTPELVKSLMESSKEDAKKNLLRSIAISELAKKESITVEETEVTEKLKEVNKQLAGEKNIDHIKLKDVITEDLLQEKVFKWLEDKNTCIEKLSTNKQKIKKSPEEDNSKTKSKKSNSKVNKSKKD